jgi:hypothetical protein
LSIRELNTALCEKFNFIKKTSPKKTTDLNYFPISPKSSYGVNIHQTPPDCLRVRAQTGPFGEYLLV